MTTPASTPLPVHLVEDLADGWRRIFLAELRALATPATVVTPPGLNRPPRKPKRRKGSGDVA